MLRITLHHDGRQSRLVLAGRLSGPWVDETESVWRSASCSDKEMNVDMTEVTGVDSAGRDLLVVMHREGTRLIGNGVWMRALIQEITGERPFNSYKPQRRRKNSPDDNDSRLRREIK
jgi:ABC-type transporter Mla MlaB component